MSVLYSGFFSFFFPMVFHALMSNWTPNLNYTRKKGAEDVRRIFVNVMLILHMKSKPAAVGSHTQTKEEL